MLQRDAIRFVHPLARRRELQVVRHDGGILPAARGCYARLVEPVGTAQCAVGAIVVRDRSILLVKRDREPARGLWSLPGGRVEAGETLAEAVVREVREETGLDVTVDGLCGVAERIERDDDGAVRYHYVILDFYATARRAEVLAGDDASEVRWVPLDALGELHLTAGLVEFLTDRGVIALKRPPVRR
jgi:ADP-ribose pyrophosphatase YjhB (NUDIX family)